MYSMTSKCLGDVKMLSFFSFTPIDDSKMMSHILETDLFIQDTVKARQNGLN